jgi:hypothetical protein
MVSRGRARWAWPRLCSVGIVPKLWLYTQIAIIVFVVAGMVIAITKLV